MKKYKVLWTFTARKDLGDIIEYISKDSIKIAIEKYEKIKEASQRLDRYPEQGRIIPELLDQNIRKYREIIITPWKIDV